MSEQNDWRDDYLDEMIAQGMDPDKLVIIEGPVGDVNISTRGSAETREFAPVRVERVIERVTRRSSLGSVCVVLTMLLASFVLACVLDEVTELRKEVKAIASEVERIRTPAVRASDTENGAFPMVPPKKPGER